MFAIRPERVTRGGPWPVLKCCQKELLRGAKREKRQAKVRVERAGFYVYPGDKGINTTSEEEHRDIRRSGRIVKIVGHKCSIRRLE